MEATDGGSGGIPLDPSLETGRGKENNLKKWKLEFLWLQETGTRLEQEQEEEKIARIFFQKIRSYNEGKSKGEDLQIDNIPKLGEKWSRMYEWILVMMGYIDEMVCWELKALRTDRIKFVLYEAARIGEREGMENLVNPKKESGEDYTRRIQEFLETAREENRRKKKITGLKGICQQEYSTQQERRRRQRRTKEGKKVNR